MSIIKLCLTVRVKKKLSKSNYNSWSTACYFKWRGQQIETFPKNDEENLGI